MSYMVLTHPVVFQWPVVLYPVYVLKLPQTWVFSSLMCVNGFYSVLKLISECLQLVQCTPCVTDFQVTQCFQNKLQSNKFIQNSFKKLLFVMKFEPHM